MSRAGTRAAAWMAGGYAVLGLLALIAQSTALALHEDILLRAVARRSVGALLSDGAQGSVVQSWLPNGILTALGVQLVLGLIVAELQRRRQRHTPGRMRLLLLGTSGAFNAIGLAGMTWFATRPESTRLLRAGLGLSVPPQWMPWFTAAMVVAAASALTWLGAQIAAWFLLQAKVRHRIWLAIDVPLFAAAAYAIATMPASPVERIPGSLGLALTRQILTGSAALRLLMRFVPPALTGVETIGFESLVAARHLRSKKSGFLATISLLSVGAVCLSCMALTTTLSVMGGFRNDLKRKILGNNAHIVVDTEQSHIDDWQSKLVAIDRVRNVTGAAPFVSGEVMLSSASNLATAVLRGIDPARIGKVNDLPRNLTAGKLAFLDHPQKLLELPPAGAGGAPLLLDSTSLKRIDSAADAGSATERDSDAGVDLAVTHERDKPAAPTDPTSKEARKLDLEKRLEALDDFLRKGIDPKVDLEPRELLPGIIIGQELARALRLYVGDEVNVVSPLGGLGPSGPMPKSRAFRVAGIFYSGMYEYDMKFTYVALGTAQSFLNVGEAISGVEVRVGDIERAPEVAAAIRGALDDKSLRVRDWQELNSRLFGALALEKLAMFVALGIAILVASFCIAGTLTLMVQEKGREVAVLKAMGTSDSAVVRVFVIEGGLIGLLGASLGLLLGYLACFAAEHFGIRMNPEVYYIDRLPVHVDPMEFLLTGLAAIAVCLVITIYPALLASRLRPVDALRYE